MAKMEDFNSKSLSQRLVERTKSGEFKYMVLRNENTSDPGVRSPRKSMRISVKRMFNR